MTFYEVLEQIITLLQQHKRLSYRALQRQFSLDDAYLADLKEELVNIQQLAVEHDGSMLVWTGPGSLRSGLTLAHPPQPAFALADPRREGAASPPQMPIPEAERRQLTVLFCDVVQSTRLSGRLDPEDYLEVVRAYQRMCAHAIQRYEGYIAQYLGDGVLAYFGYPHAHEAEAQRAVYTACEIIVALNQLNTRLQAEYGVHLALRLGIHTGLAVIGDMSTADHHRQLALGATPNIAARLQQIAAPNTIAISAVTYRLVQEAFVCQALGARTLRGMTQPLLVYQVLQPRETHSRVEATQSRSQPPLVGRERELAFLLERWEQARTGSGQVVLISGEAGIGKSRLVKALKDRIAREHSILMSEIRCSPFHQHSAWYPIIDLFQRILQFTPDEPAATRLRKLEAMLAQYDFTEETLVPLFAALLSIPLEGRYLPLTLPPQQQKRQTLDALLAVRAALMAQQPVLTIVEDVHWADPSTCEWIQRVLDQVATGPSLALLIFRPEFQPPWSMQSHMTSLTLTRLTEPDVAIMLRQLAGGKTLPAAVVDPIISKTDGVPLFVEELLKMVLELGLVREEADHYSLSAPLPPLAIPNSLQNSLMARLDRLQAGKAVAQVGAVVGREFRYDMLQAVAQQDEATMREGLAQVVQAGLFSQRGNPPHATYVFKHALIQDAAYQSLLRSVRQQYHLRIAQRLEERFPHVVASQPELVAHHYRRSGHAAQAITYLQHAGRLAAERAAYDSSITHLTEALALLATLPDTPERAHQELALQIALGTPLMVARGYGAPAVEQAFVRSRELCQHLGDTPQLASTLQRGWNMYLIRAQLHRAQELGEELLALAEHHHDITLRLRAHLALGVTLYYRGLFVSAQEHLEHSLALYDPDQHQSPHGLQDPRVTALGYLAWIRWLGGYANQARQLRSEMLTLAQQLDHPNTLAAALTYAVGLSVYLQDMPSVRDWAAAIIALCTEHGFPLYLVPGTISQGWARVMLDQPDAGLAQLQQGLAAHQAQGTELDRPGFLSFLAAAYGHLGQPEAGLQVLTEALTRVGASDERYYEAELYRLQGVLLVQSARHRNGTATSAAHFRQAMEAARRQQAKSFELRAATSLARLWQGQGKRHEARQLLAPLYDWFTEGFDTTDLQTAKALLDELSD